MRPPKEKWQRAVDCVDSMMSLVTKLVCGEKPAMSELRAVQRKVDAFKEHVFSAEECEMD